MGEVHPDSGSSSDSSTATLTEDQQVLTRRQRADRPELAPLQRVNDYFNPRKPNQKRNKADQDAEESHDQSNRIRPEQSNMAAGSKEDFERIAAAFDRHVGVRIQVDEPLSHTNYKKWSQAVGTHLRFYQLSALIDREWSDEAKSLPQFAHMNLVCRDSILNNCTEYYQQMIESEQDSGKIWKSLRDHFEGSKLVQAIRAMRALSETIQTNEQDLERVLVNFKNHVRDLRTLCPSFPDLLLIGLLAAVVPKTAESTVKQLMMSKSDAQGNPTMKLEDALQMFQNDLHLKSSQAPKETMRSTIFNLNAQSGKHKQENGGNKELRCLYCHRAGHPLKECRSYKADLASGQLKEPIVFAPGGKRFKKTSGGEAQAGQNADKNKKAKKDGKSFDCAIICKTNDDEIPPESWVLDSGCGPRHAVKSLLGCVKRNDGYEPPVYTAGNHPLPVSGSGDFQFKSLSSGNTLNVKDAYICPELSANFLSFGLLDEQGFTMIGCNGKIAIWDGSNLVATAVKGKCGLYYMDFDLQNASRELIDDESAPNGNATRVNAVACRSASPQTVEMHERLGHANVRALKEIETQLGIKVSGQLECLVCKLAKLKKLPFPRHIGLATTGPLQLVHSDLSGIIRLPNPDGFRYFLVFIDDYSKHRATFLLTRKYQVLEAFKVYLESMERKTNCKLMVLRSDNGGEYVSDEFKKFVQSRGIHRHLIVPRCSQQNGDAESQMRVIPQTARAMMIDAKLDVRFWPRAILGSTFLRNNLPCSSIGNKVPNVVLTGRAVDYSKILKWGSRVVALDLVPDHKFAFRGRPALIVGYPDDHQAHEIFLIEEKKFEFSRDVHVLSAREIEEFDDRFGGGIPRCTQPDQLRRLFHEDNENSGDRILDNETQARFVQSDDVEADSPAEESAPPSANRPEIREAHSIGNEPPNGRFVLNRSQRERLKNRFPNCKFQFVAPHASSSRSNRRTVWDVSTRINSLTHVFDKEEADVFVPRSYRQAMESNDRLLWKAEMDEEKERFVANKVYRLVKRPEGERVLPGMWLFKVKLDEHGRVVRRKARYVILGNRQLLVSGNTYSPVINALSLRTLLALAVDNGLDVHHVDVQSAYLYSPLRERVYMQQMPGYVKSGEEHLVCELQKAVYGLKASAKAWFDELSKVLEQCGLFRLLTDECIFSNGKTGKEMIIVACYVDDLNLIGATAEIERVKSEISKHFAITDKGRINDCLGLTVSYDLDAGVLKISQRKYVQEMLIKFGMQNSKGVHTPIGSGIQLIVENHAVIDDVELYRSIVGSLLYLSNNSRPDLAYAVGLLSRYSDRPGKVHLETAKRVLRYAKATVNSTLTYRKGGEKEITVMADADFARDPVESISVSGVCSFVGPNLVGWSSFKQNRVAQSTCESEILSCLDGVNELEYLRDLLAELKMNEYIGGPSTIYNDNQGCLSSVQNGGAFRSSKHYKVRLNRVRKAVRDGLCVFRYRATDEMTADGLTKPLSFDAMVRTWKCANLLIVKD